MSEITKLEKENIRLIELCAKHADRADELYAALGMMLEAFKCDNSHIIYEYVNAKAVFDQSEIEAALKQN